MKSRFVYRAGSVWVGILAGGIAVLLGAATSHVDLTPAVIGLLTLLPVASHVRWLGLRRAIAEPSVVTIILFFYLSVFPQRGLAIALNDFADVEFAHTVGGTELASALVLASLATAVLVEAFHIVRTRRRTGDGDTRPDAVETRSGIVPLATLLGTVNLVALIGIIAGTGGLAGAQSAFLSHGKAVIDEARSLPLSVWTTGAIPAVWCAAYAAVSAGRRAVRCSFAVVAAVIVLGMVIVFGSRLDALLALMGAWAVVHYSGRTIPVGAVLASVPILVLLSVPILSQREGGDLTGLSPYDKYSRIASYGMLDASLAVQQHPGDVARKLRDSQRWLDLPLYLVPSPVWPDKPRLDAARMDVYVAQSVGSTQQQDTGLPTSYVTEWWLYGGWLAVVLASAAIGGVLGALHRTLVGPSAVRSRPAALIWYCVVVLAGFSYYKDGDLLMSLVGSARTAMYVGLAMLLTGAWTPLRGNSDSASSRRGPVSGPSNSLHVSRGKRCLRPVNLTPRTPEVME